MAQGHSTLGFVVIMILYAVIGLLAAAGTVSIARKAFTPKAEQIFYGMFLIMIAAFYLAFTAYFGVSAAWRLEAGVVAAYVVIGALAVRLPFAEIRSGQIPGPFNIVTSFLRKVRGVLGNPWLGERI